MILFISYIGLLALTAWILYDKWKGRHITFKDGHGNKYLIKRDGKIERLSR